jgi:hypothetical protein
MRHELKITHQDFSDIINQIKTYMIQKDQGFKVRDKLHLQEWNFTAGHPTNRHCIVVITHISKGEGDLYLTKDTVVMAIRLAKWAYDGSRLS